MRVPPSRAMNSLHVVAQFAVSSRLHEIEWARAKLSHSDDYDRCEVHNSR